MCNAFMDGLPGQPSIFKEGYNPLVPPRSNLGTSLTMMMSGTITSARGIPLTQLMGRAPSSASGSGITAQDPGMSGNTGNHTMQVPPSLAAELQKIKSCLPGCTASTLLEHTEAANLALGPPRSCMQLRLFGKCQSTDCSYRHGKSPAGESQINRVLIALKKITRVVDSSIPPPTRSAPTVAPAP